MFLLVEMVIVKRTRFLYFIINPLEGRRKEDKDYRKLIRQGGLPMALPFEQGYRIINRSNGSSNKDISLLF